VLGATDKFNTREKRDAAGQEHGEALELHFPVLAAQTRRQVPFTELPALGLIVNVIKQAVLGHKKGIALEWTL